MAVEGDNQQVPHHSESESMETKVVEATLVSQPSKNDDQIRSGSPFRGEPKGGTVVPGSNVELVPGYDPFRDGSITFDQGIIAATAWGGVLASYCTLPFAIIAAWLFPFGAVLVAALGGLLAVFGLSSKRAIPTVGAIVGHFVAGVCGYVQLL